MAVAKKLHSMDLLSDGDIDKSNRVFHKISNKDHLGFAQVTNPSLCKSMCKATVWSYLLFWQHAALSESCKHSNNLRMSFFFIQKTVKRWAS